MDEKLMYVCVRGRDRARCWGAVRTYHSPVVIDGKVLVDNPVYSRSALTDVMMDWPVYCNMQRVRC